MFKTSSEATLVHRVLLSSASPCGAATCRISYRIFSDFIAQVAYCDIIKQVSAAADRAARRGASRPQCCAQMWPLSVINWWPTMVTSLSHWPSFTSWQHLRRSTCSCEIFVVRSSSGQRSRGKYPCVWSYRNSLPTQCRMSREKPLWQICNSAVLWLTNPRNALYHGKRQNFKTNVGPTCRLPDADILNISVPINSFNYIYVFCYPRRRQDFQRCLCFSFFHMISHKPMHLGSLNLTYRNVPPWIMETHLFWSQKVKGQGHKAQKHCQCRTWRFFFWLIYFCIRYYFYCV